MRVDLDEVERSMNDQLSIMSDQCKGIVGVLDVKLQSMIAELRSLREYRKRVSEVWICCNDPSAQDYLCCDYEGKHADDCPVKALEAME